MKKVLPAVIDECQSTFLKDRGLLDSVVVANEVIEELKRGERRGLCLKVDYEKAYDSVSWVFLLDMLQRLGFHRRWIMWIKGCLESASISVLVNGSPTLEFNVTRGLRQGDPLTPFLFIMVAEGLSDPERQAIKANLLAGIKVSRKEVEASVLQFADDTLFLCEDSYYNVFSIKAILRCYELASELNINFHKSKLARVNVGREVLDVYAKTLHCTLMRIPFKYLGLEVGGNPRKKLFWEPIIERLSTTLNVWKGRSLSLAGRVDLVKLVFTFLLLFYLSFFKAPQVVCDKIISIQRRFLWGWGREKRSIPWVSWENLCKPMEEGGLGIKNVRNFNGTLLAKWKWRLMGEEKGMWKEILVSKYGMDIERNRKNEKFHSWWWKDLCMSCGEGGEVSWFHDAIGWKVGKGDKARFWEDAWMGSNPLKVKYPRLFSIYPWIREGR